MQDLNSCTSVSDAVPEIMVERSQKILPFFCKQVKRSFMISVVATNLAVKHDIVQLENRFTKTNKLILIPGFLIL